MVATLERPIAPTTTVEPVAPAPAVDPITELLEAPFGDQDPAGERWRRVQRLLAETGSDRPALERLQHRYLQRLHRSATDLVATRALWVVEQAIGTLPEAPQRWKGWQWERDQRRSRRRRRRHRRR